MVIIMASTPLNLYPLPGDNFNISDPDERIRFKIPYISGSNMDMYLELALDSGFTQVVFRRYTWQDTSIWTYYNGSAYVEWPSNGVNPIYYGNEARINIYGLIDPHQPILYWRVRGVVRP